MEDQETQSAPGLKTSVLIVSYNSKPALRRCLEALRAAVTPDATEVLVIDCGSTDGSPQIDEDFPEVTILRLPRNFGRTKARNIGIRTAKGKFLFLLEPDVLVCSDTISSLSGILDQDERVVGVAPLLVTATGESVSRCGNLPAPMDLYRAWCVETPWHEINPLCRTPGDEPVDVECPDPRALLVRAQAVRGMNYFDERYGEFGSDLELYTQAYKASRKLKLVPSVRVECRPGDGMWQSQTEDSKETLAADCAAGVIAYTGKHYGWYPAFRLRLRMIFRALAHLQFGLLTAIINGQKIDGTQRGL